MDNVVRRGADEGHTWTVPKELQEAEVYAIIQNPYFSDYAYCITRGKIFYTSDSGDSFKEIKAPMDPNNLQLPILNFHPDKSDYLIYTGSTGCENVWSPNCHSEAFYTLDNQEWKSIEKYVRVCQWARNKKFRRSDENLIVCESYRDKEGSQLSFYDNPLELVLVSSFNKKDTKNNNIVGTAIFDEFMIVAEILPSGQSLRLLVSLDTETFAEAQFPLNIPTTQEAYTALQSNTHAIMLHVTTTSIKTKNKYGSILKSNGNGTYYTLSLENANRDDTGFVDFEKMQGIQGIALANIVSNVYEVNMGNDKKLKTMITFNDGSTWKLLKRPKFDSNDHKYKCDGNSDDKCSLHLHSYTERRNPRDSFSSSSAIGLMMGVGNVGSYLTPYLEGDTFLTRDAGLTWIEVRKGAYMYEFGNQGSIIVLVDDEQVTDHILYSLNEGLEWQEYKFTKVGEQPIKVFDVDIMPGGLSSKFILRGYDLSRNNEEVVVHLDFSNIFTKDCDLNNDFEKWTPYSGDDECLFGHEISYLRKIREVECFINENLRYKRERGEDCTCTLEHDFECDYNYMRNSTGECHLVDGTKPLQRTIAELCANGEIEWYEMPGYRKLESSTCKGGKLPSFPCPAAGRSVLYWIIIILLTIFIFVGILICFTSRRYGGYSSAGRIRLGGAIEPNSILSSIADIFYQIRMPRFVSRLWSNIPLPGRRNRYHYSPVATDDGEVLMDDYDQDNEAL